MLGDIHRPISNDLVYLAYLSQMNEELTLPPPVVWPLVLCIRIQRTRCCTREERGLQGVHTLPGVIYLTATSQSCRCYMSDNPHRPTESSELDSTNIV